LFLNETTLNTKIFIDANIFVYHFSAGSIFNKSCTDFLAEVEAKKFQGFTSTAIVQEAIHRLMMVEASSVLDTEVKNLPKYLKLHPDVVKELKKHLIVPGKISSLNIEIVQITPKLIEESQELKTEYGFLTNDALSLKIMKDLNIIAIASNDLDFRRVDWLNLFLPVPTS